MNQLVLIDQAAAYIELLYQAYDIYTEYAGIRPNNQIYCILDVSIKDLETTKLLSGLESCDTILLTGYFLF